MTADPFPSAPGAYVLLLALTAPARLTVGRLGTFDFPPGYYTYVGSAHGPGGLAGRLKHHLAPTAQPHWHIDRLRKAAAVAAVWWCADEEIREHGWAAALANLSGGHIIARRFGASDCHCPSHLLHFAAHPDFAAFAECAGGVIEFTELSAPGLRP
ncbi:MAG TPA: GIY-YIG nuclease family protein [Candidatus Limnocylindrales bacterium]|nr:GIY-YIG nuclease family protein [Candidatus Limnocylindrales bacterium]